MKMRSPRLTRVARAGVRVRGLAAFAEVALVVDLLAGPLATGFLATVLAAVVFLAAVAFLAALFFRAAVFLAVVVFFAGTVHLSSADVLTRVPG